MSADTNGGTIRLTFTHSRNSSKKEMNVGPTITPKKAIEGLVAQGFIEPASNKSNYVLSLERTGKTIPESQTFVTAGAKDGDVVVITATDVGAQEAA